MWKEYEKRKRIIQQLNLPPEEYEKEIQKVIKEIEENGNDSTNFITKHSKI